MKLSEEQIAAQLETVEWRREGDQIIRDWKLANFGEAVAFVNEVAKLAEAADHHPDILLHRYNRVRLVLTTHFVNGLTTSDFELARRIDALR